MKFSTIFIFAASSVLAAPVFWGHPNVQVGLAPELPYGQVIDLQINDLFTQNPQDQIWYTGGLVGYFTNEWQAPVWTTPLVDLRVEPNEREPVPFSQPNAPPVNPVIKIGDPPDPKPVIIYSVPPAPVSTPGHHSSPYSHTSTPTPDPPAAPPPGPTNPEVVINPPAITGVPEPNLAPIVALILAAAVGIQSRIDRRR
ncbi:MAG: hypothetical protein ABIO24_09705 [Saprospiraceae bacterium]